MSVSFFYGDEDYLIEQEISKLKDKLLDKNFSAMNYKYVKSPKYQDLISLLRTQPMMFGSQMIVIDVKNYFKNQKNNEASIIDETVENTENGDEMSEGDNFSLDNSQIEEIRDSLENVAPSLHIIFTLIFERDSKTKKPDSRKKIYKVLSQCTEMKEFATIPFYDTTSIINFINKEAKNQGVTFEKQASLRLAEQVGNNLRELVKEIEKLVLIAYPKDKISEDMVKQICITNEDVFSLTDKLFNGQKASALKEFRKLCEKQYPLAIFSAIQTNLRKALILKLNGKNLSSTELSKLTGFREPQIPYKIKELKDANLKDLARLKRNFARAELNIKAGKALDVQEEIEKAFF